MQPGTAVRIGRDQRELHLADTLANQEGRFRGEAGQRPRNQEEQTKDVLHPWVIGTEY